MVKNKTGAKKEQTNVSVKSDRFRAMLKLKELSAIQLVIKIKIY